MIRRDEKVVAWAVVGAYAALIFYFSSLSHPLPQPVSKYFQDWVLHSVEYGLFGILLAWAAGLSFPALSSSGLIALVFLVGTLYGISDEWHQSFVPERESCVKDALVDAAAVFCGAYAWTRKKTRD